METSPMSLRSLHRKRRLARPRLGVERLEDRACPSALPQGGPLVPADAATQAQMSHAYGQLPLSFEANQGQTDAQVNFLSRGSGYNLFLTPTQAALDLNQGSTGNLLTMQLVGSNRAAQTVGLDP